MTAEQIPVFGDGVRSDTLTVAAHATVAWALEFTTCDSISDEPPFRLTMERVRSRKR